MKWQQEMGKSDIWTIMDGVFDRYVFSSAAALAGLNSFDEPLPQPQLRTLEEDIFEYS
jgi:hypothetical protein